MDSWKLFVCVFVAPFLTGCFTKAPQKPISSGITLSKAMKDVGKGFYSLKQELKGKGDELGNKPTTTGMVAKETNITFNVTADEKESGDLKLNIAPVNTPSSGSSIGLNADKSSGLITGNTVTVTLTSSLNYLQETTITKTCEPKLDGDNKPILDQDSKKIEICTTKTVTKPLDENAFSVLKEWSKFTGDADFSAPLNNINESP